MTKCDRCGQPTPLLEHKFYKGVLSEKPLLIKHYWAPLYHKNDRSAGYCGAICATAAA